MPKMPLPPAESMTLDSLAEVARGGMGSVELARVVDGRLAGQILAVKRLHPNIAEEPDFVSMFLDEAWMTAALKSPNVAQVVAWGNDDKGMFLAIELVQGVSLSRLYKESQQNQEPFAERTVAFICSQLCNGLVAAHTATTPDGSPLGLVHRDLTPANVLISFDGIVKVIDFGIAKAEERISHTRAGQLKGKPAYMAPEQQRGGAVDARADLFSFGVCMFELLAGRRPWTSKGAFDVMMEISNDPHPDLGELRKGLNPQLVEITHRCLQKRAEDRFNSALEIKALLDAWLAAKGFSSDDQHSLAQFVLRNSQPQVLWWQQALRGEHSKKKAPTFKELEEKIDEDRAAEAKAARKATAQPPPRPAGGFGKGTQPMTPYRGPGLLADSNGPPSSGPTSPRQPPSSGSPMQGRDSVLGPPASLARPQAHPQAPQAGGASFGSGQYAYAAPTPPVPPAQSLAGTEFMAVSPFASGDPRLQGPPPSGSLASTVMMNPAAATVMLHTPSTVLISPPLDQTVNDVQSTVPMGPGLAMSDPAQAILAFRAQLSAAPPRASPDPSTPAAPVSGAVGRGRGSRLALVVLFGVLVLGGVGLGAWLYVQSLEPGARQHAPARR